MSSANELCYCKSNGQSHAPVVGATNSDFSHDLFDENNLMSSKKKKEAIVTNFVKCDVSCLKCVLYIVPQQWRFDASPACQMVVVGETEDTNCQEYTEKWLLFPAPHCLSCRNLN